MAPLSPDANSEAAQPEHALYAFDVLAAKLSGSPAPAVPSFTLPNSSQEPSYPLFVTWNIQTGSHYTLRGCIGTFSPLPLARGIAEYAVVSAFDDTRFNPITSAELPHLECGISLLTNFETCKDAYDWTVGTHGIWIHFSRPGSKRRKEHSATFLPDVPPHAGWDKQDTLKHAIKKAGHSGPIDDALIASLRVERYQSSKIALTYADWQAARLASGPPTV